MPIAKGASGGELSRVMLALEVCLAGSAPPATMVFDEVDAGVGGKAAVEIGRRLARLAAASQVIVVTHLPQVAAFADRHYVVVRSSDGVGDHERGDRPRRGGPAAGAVADAGRARGLRDGAGPCRASCSSSLGRPARCLTRPDSRDPKVTASARQVSARLAVQIRRSARRVREDRQR